MNGRALFYRIRGHLLERPTESRMSYQVKANPGFTPNTTLCSMRESGATRSCLVLEEPVDLRASCQRPSGRRRRSVRISLRRVRRNDGNGRRGKTEELSRLYRGYLPLLRRGLPGPMHSLDHRPGVFPHDLGLGSRPRRQLRRGQRRSAVRGRYDQVTGIASTTTMIITEPDGTWTPPADWRGNRAS